MTEHPNFATVRAAMDSMSSGDMQGMVAALSEGVVWHEIGNPEPIRGKAALGERMSGGAGGFEFESGAHDIVGNDDHVVVLAETTATRDGKSFSYRTAEIFHVNDGKITERWAFSDDTDAINRFFGS